MDRYFTEWPVDNNASWASWWNDGRKQLNKVIRLVNDWTINGKPDAETDVLLRHIDMGLQTYADQDGAEAWVKDLKEMADYIKEG